MPPKEEEIGSYNFSSTSPRFSRHCSILIPPKHLSLSSSHRTYKTLSPPKSSKLFSDMYPTHKSVMLEASFGILTPLYHIFHIPHPNTKLIKSAHPYIKISLFLKSEHPLIRFIVTLTQSIIFLVNI